VKITINEIGKNPQKPIATMKEAITNIKICPTIIFAPRRIDKLTGLTMYVKNSSTIIKGAKNIGVPVGRKNEKNFKPWIAKAIIVIDMNTNIPIANVIDI